MADVEQQTPVEASVDDVEMEGAADAGVEDGAGAGEEAVLPGIEPEAPKLVLFAE